MKQKIVVFTDSSREVPYQNVVLFNELRIVETADESVLADCDCDLAIVDYSSIAEGVKAANEIRKRFPSMPILFLDDLTSSTFPFYFKQVGGYGQLRTLNWRSEYPEELNEAILSMLHPEYPNQKSDIAIILPAFNEESRFHNVLDFVDQLKIIMGEVFVNSNVYFVNDGSVDNTQKLIEKLVAETGEQTDMVSQRALVNARNLSYNTRKAGTYIEGIKSIDADILVFADADNSFLIEDIALMINLIREGYYDMVVATKDFSTENRPPIRRLMSFGKRLLTKPFLPQGVYDSQTGLKAMRSLAARSILPYLHENTGLAIDLEMLYLAKKFNFRVLQLPVTSIEREGSHVHPVKDSIAFVKTLVKIARANRSVNIGNVPHWGKRPESQA